MRLFGIYDLAGGKDRADLIGDGRFGAGPPVGALRAFAGAGVRFFDRGARSDARSSERTEEAVVVMQGRGRIVVDGIEHPVRFGDVVVIEPGESVAAVADEIDPFVLLTFSARVP